MAVYIVNSVYIPECHISSTLFMLHYRDVEKQETVWKYTMECLKDYITDDVMKGLEDPPQDPSGQEEEEAKGEDEAKGDEAAAAAAQP